jgi:hypothetical protein
VRTRSILLALVGLVLVVTASPAAADPAGPTNYRSTVTGADTELDGVEVDVLGGDAYVLVEVEPGVEVVVDGYEDEPYLRISADGTVERNEASPSRWLNDARFGGLEVTVPPEASAEAPPRWEVVADGGRYAWHDHRVHWMVPGIPDQVDPGAGEVQRVSDWELELSVDGQDAAVSGQLDWVPSPSPVLPVIVTLVVAALGVVLVLRRPAVAPVVALVGAAAAGTVGVASAVGLPPGADWEPALVVLPAVTLLLVGVSRLLRRRGGTGAAVVTALAGFPILVWSVLLVRAFASPIVPTALPSPLARVLIAVALGVGLVAVVDTARAVLRAPSTPPPSTTAAPSTG